MGKNILVEASIIIVDARGCGFRKKLSPKNINNLSIAIRGSRLSGMGWKDEMYDNSDAIRRRCSSLDEHLKNMPVFVRKAVRKAGINHKVFACSDSRETIKKRKDGITREYRDPGLFRYISKKLTYPLIRQMIGHPLRRYGEIMFYNFLRNIVGNLLYYGFIFLIHK